MLIQPQLWAPTFSLTSVINPFSISKLSTSFAYMYAFVHFYSKCKKTWLVNIKPGVLLQYANYLFWNWQGIKHPYLSYKNVASLQTQGFDPWSDIVPISIARRLHKKCILMPSVYLSQSAADGCNCNPVTVDEKHQIEWVMMKHSEAPEQECMTFSGE